MKTQMKAVYGITKQKDENRWTQIGVAFVNHDGSWNLKLDYLPANLLATTLQVRDFKRTAAEASQPEAAE